MINANITKNNLKIVSTYLYEYLKLKGIESFKKNSYRCLNPAHKDTHPSMFLFKGSDSGKLHLKCQSCGCSMDIFNTVEVIDKIKGLKNQYAYICNLFQIDLLNPLPSRDYANLCITKQKSEEEIIKYIQQCHNSSLRRDYWQQRNIPTVLQDEYNLGFDKNDNALVIPIGSGCLKRFINPKGPKYKRSVGLRENFISHNLNNNMPIIITEGEIDALSILACGYPNVISTGGIANLNHIFSQLVSTSKLIPIIATDNDVAGKNAYVDLIHLCVKNNWNSPDFFWNHVEDCNILPQHYKQIKDINEFLQKDKTLLESILTIIARRLD
ncbi:toprim domain-containing protein [Veillonella criceti]|uniref:DNA primase (Bacterial type) n=1 Tax=Veillonella criceti TaxID=103891 RepID=A0A380NJZ4_9FIRM|nr:toprim domain-containing protein [Veillonella criceti]SUP42818.1 DNA primase (bacterial type) [Veillonella criceti]